MEKLCKKYHITRRMKTNHNDDNIFNKLKEKPIL